MHLSGLVFVVGLVLFVLFLFFLLGYLSLYWPEMTCASSAHIAPGRVQKTNSLRNVSLPPSLREIRAEAFVGCKALTALSFQETSGHRAFGECTALCYLTYCKCKRVAWRRPQPLMPLRSVTSLLPLGGSTIGSDWMVPPGHTSRTCTAHPCLATLCPVRGSLI